MESAGTSIGVRKGGWTEQEDVILKNFIEKYGEGKWHSVPSRAGLNRCRKSCRLRWLNYLRPNIKRGEFKFDEVDLMVRLHKLLGNRWTLIAGRLPGRTANDVKNYWNTHLRKKMNPHDDKVRYKSQERSMESKIIKPQPRTFSKNSLLWQRGKCSMVNLAHNNTVQSQDMNPPSESSPPSLMMMMPQEENIPIDSSWWESLLVESNKTETSSKSWSGDEPVMASQLLAEEIVPTGEGTKVVGFGGRSDRNVEGQSGCNCESFFDMDLWNLLDLENEMVA